jgi:excisionase family DNA binding protein
MRRYGHWRKTGGAGTTLTPMSRPNPLSAATGHAPQDELLTISQAGEYLGTGERFIRRLVAQRRISYVKLGKYVRLQRSSLDAFIEAGRVPSE